MVMQLIIFFLNFPIAKSADPSVNPSTSLKLQVPILQYTETLNLTDYIFNLYKATTYIIVPIIIVVIILSGIAWIGSGGDSGQIQNAKKMIFRAFAALGIVLLSYTVLSFVGLSSIRDITPSYIEREKNFDSEGGLPPKGASPTPSPSTTPGSSPSPAGSPPECTECSKPTAGGCGSGSLANYCCIDQTPLTSSDLSARDCKTGQCGGNCVDSKWVCCLQPGKTPPPTPPSPPPSSTGNYTHSEALGLLNGAGISVTSSGIVAADCAAQKSFCPTTTYKCNPPCRCTSLEQIPKRVVDNIIRMKAADPSCAIRVTGGTEPCHIEHGPGRAKVDLNSLACVGTLLNSGQYGVSKILNEGDHYHVTF